jgi:serine/threonine protein kinase
MDSTLQREETVFYAALKIADPAQRKVFVEQACAGDAQLRAAVEELLVTQDDAERFFVEGKSALVGELALASDAGVTPQQTQALAAEEQIGVRIGRYKLLQRLGEGGCGVVYMAEQEEPVRRKVALKIIKLGMDTKSVIGRFEAERQALAMMDHPNIARVLDAGATDTGRPFFVMELVRGVKITDYCDQSQSDTPHRLDLFIQICQAIQHAHQKGIIHRDIKPSNILVTMHDGTPVPKVIDFGIAKATEGRLTDKTVFTAYEQFLGTPAYMSPEQAELSGLDVDTRSDIYSLGVLLYELLTGRTPFDAKKLLQSGLDEMRRTLREREPQRPSIFLTTLQGEELRATASQRQSEPPKLISLIHGDLDWIVMKALEKDRRRRYETANGLAMDIRRYLSNEPVVARPPSRLYRFRKLVRRNKGVFVAGGAVAASLIAGLAVSTWLFLDEREARQRAVAAERQQARLRQEAETRATVTQASAQAHLKNYEQADDLATTITTPQPSVESADLFRSLGEWHALQGEWEPAIARFKVMVGVDLFDGWDLASLDWLAYGTALAESTGAEPLAQFRARILERFKDTANPVVAERVVKISLLVPNHVDAESLAPLAAVAEKAFVQADTNSVNEVFQAAWGSISLALMEYRRGNWSGAITWAGRCLSFAGDVAPRTATAHVLLAMADQQLHRHDEAQKEFEDARRRIENRFKSGLERGDGPQGFWFDWVFARVLLREASNMMQGETATTNGH